MIIQCMGRLYVRDDAYETWPSARTQVTQSDFPYLTLENVIAVGQSGLNQAAVWFPEAAPELHAVGVMLPLLAAIPLIQTAVQRLLDEINRVTGAQPGAV
jgi:hypothetical protein